MTSAQHNIILVVDDEAANLSVLFQQLRRAGFKVMVSEDGAGALESVEYTTPDIMLLDVKLPDMDGFELYRRLKTQPDLAGTPVIFISVLTDTHEKLKAFQSSAVDYVTKPFDPEELVARVHKHLTIRNLRKQLEETNAQLRQEIAERKQKETSLQNSREQLALITDNIPALIGYIDARQRYIYVNQAYAEWYRSSKDDVVGRTVKEVWSEEAYHGVRHYINAVLQGERVSFETLRIDQYGQPRSVNVDYVPHFDGQGNVKAFFVLVQDITRYKQLQNALTDARNAAEAANQAKSEFLANMSHELRTPLSAILGFAQIMDHSQTLVQKDREDLGIINRAGEHLLTLIQQVLDLSKIEAGRITLNETRFDLYHLLHDVVDLFRFKAEKKQVHLLFECSPEVPQYIFADEVKLRQILLNLLSNAIKFTEEGRVSLRVSEFDELHELSTQKLRNSKTQKLLFEIEDTGSGIASEEIDTLFQAFAQTRTGRLAQEGTGLGLAISRKFVQLMGGDISVISEVGKGSMFSFNIQVRAVAGTPVESQQTACRPVALEAGQPRYRMIIAADKPDNRKLLVEFLQPFSFDLREALNGKEIIEIWQRWQPNLIWMELRMPIMDGYEATRQIRNSDSEIRNIPIIAMTASSFQGTGAAALSAGCDAVLYEPFREAEIFDLIQKHLGVRYVYEDKTIAKRPFDKLRTSQAPIEKGLTSESLAALPAEVLTELREAVTGLDSEESRKIIARIREDHPQLAEVLEKLVDTYRFDILQEYLEEKTR